MVSSTGTGGGDEPAITNEDELKAAVADAKTPAQRAHAHKHARALGLLKHIPGHWRHDGSTADSGDTGSTS